MSQIIVATDFTAVGDHAVFYACGLAVAQQSSLLIIHTYIMPVMFTDIPVPNNLMNEARHDAELQLQEIVAKLSAEYPGLAVTGKIIYGDIVDALNDNSEEKTDPWLVIIGNSNNQDKISIDSTLLDTLRQSKFPVLAVPLGTTYKKVNKICFAFDNKYKGSDVALLQLRDMQQQLNAELHVLFAEPDVANRDNTPDIEEATKTVLAPANPQYHFRYDTSVENAIKAFISEHAIDWLVVIPRRHSFIEGIFHKSHAKAMAYNTDIPVLALHENS